MVSILFDVIKFLLIYRHLQNTYWFRRGNRLSSVPLIEAFALPDTAEQTTLEAHADMIYSTTWSNSTYKHIGTILHWQ